MHQTTKPSTITNGSVGRHLDDVSVVIKTFERPESLKILLDSLLIYYPDIPVIIIDDSREPLDDNLFDARTRYVHTEHNIGLSEGRNRGVALSETEFTFIMDDDFVFTKDSRLDLLRMPLVHGGFSVSGSRMINFGLDEVVYHGSMQVEGSVLKLEMEKPKAAQNGYPVFDYCHNIFMARTEFLKANPWTPVLKLREHWDFFYRIKQKGAGLVTMRVDTSFDHYPHMPSHYKTIRHNKDTLVYIEKALELNSISRVEKVISKRFLMRKNYENKQFNVSRLFKRKQKVS